MSGHNASDGSHTFEELQRKNFKGKRALLVEDNELNAEIAKEIIGMTGIEIERVSNGELAVEKFKQVENGYYDIIFMDVQMPVMNGYEATRAIRAMSGDYAKKVPIIAMTANAFAEDVRAAKEAGMN
ncbi:MAG: response regulator [Lachnospiraceae bacterium]|nr:response regulator [Lachnospiraceae bacterium]